MLFSRSRRRPDPDLHNRSYKGTRNATAYSWRCRAVRLANQHQLGRLPFCNYYVNIYLEINLLVQPEGMAFRLSPVSLLQFEGVKLPFPRFTPSESAMIIWPLSARLFPQRWSRQRASRGVLVFGRTYFPIDKLGWVRERSVSIRERLKPSFWALLPGSKRITAVPRSDPGLPVNRGCPKPRSFSPLDPPTSGLRQAFGWRLWVRAKPVVWPVRRFGPSEASVGTDARSYLEPEGGPGSAL